MKTLFPEMEKEIREDRKAARREQAQRAREYLAKRDLSWLINRLLEKGPQTEFRLMHEASEDEYHSKDAMARGAAVLQDLYALWLVNKLWRREQGIHPGSGEKYHLYGVRGVHSPNTTVSNAEPKS